MPAYFDLPLNIPHAAEIADRIVRRIGAKEQARRRTKEAAAALAISLMAYRGNEDNPPAEEAEEVRQDGLNRARSLVDLIEAEGLGEDRLGQLVRNFFECLGEGREGAQISLRAGENPDSLQRPWSGGSGQD